jgi:DNA polymerase/3'-5' exonuclease PolX
MSSMTRMPRDSATVNINLMRGMLNKGIEKIEVCGSYRRGATTIGDVDLIVLPSDSFSFLDHMDSLVERELLKRGTNRGGKQSWGEKKRLVEFRGIPFDIELCNEHNLGYKRWIRTGPGEANTLIMGMLSKYKSRVRMDDGYLWHVTYNSNHISSRDRKEAKEEKVPAYHKLARLHVPDEETFFTLLGMPYIPPEKRDEIMYRRYLGQGINTPSPEDLKAWYLSDEQEEALANSGIKQKSLI